jgi:hypothetical protein
VKTEVVGLTVGDQSEVGQQLGLSRSWPVYLHHLPVSVEMGSFLIQNLPSDDHVLCFADWMESLRHLAEDPVHGLGGEYLGMSDVTVHVDRAALLLGGAMLFTRRTLG